MSRSSNAFSDRSMTSTGTTVFGAVPVHINPFPTTFDPPPTPPRTNSTESANSNSDNGGNSGSTVAPSEREHLRRSIHMVRSYQRRATPSSRPLSGRTSTGGQTSSSSSSQPLSTQSASAHRAAMIHAMMQQAARQAASTNNRPQASGDQMSSSASISSPSASPSSSASSSTTTTNATTLHQMETSSYQPPQHQHQRIMQQQPPSTPTRRRLFHPPPSATTPPSESRFRPVTGSGTVNPSVHPQFRSKAVCKLFCRHCTNVMCRRGMKAILLGNTKVELYSTDTPPTGVQLVYSDYLTQNCSCRIRDAACLGCGNVVGYHVTQPCEKCLEACNNGHFWMFLSDGVQPVERIDASGAKLLRWAALPCAEQDRDETEMMDRYEMLCR